VSETHSSKRVALITGANRGIGFETARQLGAQGIIVLAGSRDVHRGEQAAHALRGEGVDARCIAIDVTDQGTIDAAAARVEREFGKLDILVNNGAILIERAAPSESGIEKLRETLETNVVGLFAVTKAFVPLLRKSEAGRIVNVSSGLASLTNLRHSEHLDNDLMAYTASKAAVNALTVQFARELRDTPIKVNAAAPGYTATEMNDFQGHQTVQQGAVASVLLATLPADGPTGAFLDAKGTVPW
jgi:NAD(P)-dependent dehydrogenase (short-subunit alcohol dehydrogenase family)